jgi:branched-chain amino acid transport system ATP-binding protein
VSAGGEVLLAGRGVSRRFGGVTAVSGVDFEVRRGEIVGLIGPNGAGKTTLLNVICGVHPPDAGEITFRGQRLNGMAPHRITRLGVARTFQVVQPFRGMTVRENAAVGALFGAHATGSMSEALRRADEALEKVRLADKRDQPVGRLTLSDQKRLELARALAMQPELVLLDEVMAGLNPAGVAEIMEELRQINAAGYTLIIIEHVMKAIMGLCRRVIVLQQGRRIAEGPPDQVVQNPDVVRAYLGDRFARMQGGGGGAC